MKHNETPDAESQLSPSQELALNALMTGSRTTDGALAAGVSRSTLHRWLHEPIFIAALNGRRLEFAASASAKMLNLRGKALRVVEQALDAGDGRVALAVLRGVGMLDGQTPFVGSDDPIRVAKNQKAVERHQEMMDFLDI